MTIRLTMKNWRSIENATVDFEPLTVIVGRNSSGKSNVVDALRFVSEVAWDASNAVMKRGGITSIRRWSKSKPFDVTLRVRTANTTSDLDSRYVEHEMVLRSGKVGEWLFKREHIAVVRDDDVGSFRFDRDGTRATVNSRQQALWPAENIELDPTTSVALITRQVHLRKSRQRNAVPLPNGVRSIWPVPGEMRKPQPPTESAIVEDDARNIATALRRMKDGERLRVVEAMRRIVPGLVRVDAEDTGRYLSLVFAQSLGDDVAPTFQATEMSDGALRALAVIVAAQQVGRGDVLIVEEPEVNLHPGAAGVVYGVLRQAARRGTVIVTTHSPELLDLASDAHVLVCDYEKGVTKVGPLATEQLDLVRQGLFSVAELMRTEELRREGARPRVVAG